MNGGYRKERDHPSLKQESLTVSIAFEFGYSIAYSDLTLYIVLSPTTHKLIRKPYPPQVASRKSHTRPNKHSRPSKRQQPPVPSITLHTKAKSHHSLRRTESQHTRPLVCYDLIHFRFHAELAKRPDIVPAKGASLEHEPEFF
jgi:hypothetical protein